MAQKQHTAVFQNRDSEALRRRQSEKTQPAVHTVETMSFPAIQEVMRELAGAAPVSPAGVLQMQRTLGNQAVMRMLKHPGQVALRQADDDAENQNRGDSDGDIELSVEDEQSLLQAKRIQRTPNPEFEPGATSLIQRAWTGRRPLGSGGMNKLLGKPWIWRKAGNLLRWGGYHEHIFFEDGGTPPNIGHMGKSGLGQDTGREGEYAKVEENLDDAKMRNAVTANESMGEPGKYGLLTNNCQDFVQTVLATYRTL